MDGIRWIEPRVLAEAGQLGDAEQREWRERGFTLVDNLLPAALLRTLREEAETAFPAAGTDAAAAVTGFGSDQRFVFPSESRSFNEITLHPKLLEAVAQLLRVPVVDLLLTQSDLWPKYGRAQTSRRRDNNDQRMHVDYPNHTLVHPPPWSRPEAVEIIIFLSDVEECGGATAVVPRTGPEDEAYTWPMVQTPGVAGFDYINNREVAEEYLAGQDAAVAAFRERALYGREVRARYRAGSVLLYRHDTWHRGTPVTAGARRLVHNLTFKRADSRWVHVLHPGWSWGMYRPGRTMETLLAQSTVEQRAVLGFPHPGDAYWCRETIDAVQARYGAYGMDMTPYEEALARES